MTDLRVTAVDTLISHMHGIATLEDAKNAVTRAVAAGADVESIAESAGVADPLDMLDYLHIGLDGGTGTISNVWHARIALLKTERERAEQRAETVRALMAREVPKVKVRTGMSEVGLATLFGVQRQTIRSWFGK